MIKYINLSTEDIDSVIKLGIQDQDEFQCIEECDFWHRDELFEWFSSESDICLGAFWGPNLVAYWFNTLKLKN